MLELTEKARSFPAALCEGLVGYWRMEEAAWTGEADEVIDLSGNGNHGTAKGGASTAADGKLGRAGDFDATSQQYIELPPDIFNQNAGTWAMWVKGMWSTQGAVRFFNNLQGGGGYNAFRVNRNGINLDWVVGNGSSTAQVTIPLPADGPWGHILYTWEYDGTNTTVTGYLNNVAGTPVVISGQIVQPTVPITVMFWYAFYTTGMIDEVTVHDRKINSGERAALYNAGAAVLLPLSDSFALPLEVADIRPEMEVIEV